MEEEKSAVATVAEPTTQATEPTEAAAVAQAVLELLERSPELGKQIQELVDAHQQRLTLDMKIGRFKEDFMELVRGSEVGKQWITDKDLNVGAVLVRKMLVDVSGKWEPTIQFDFNYTHKAPTQPRAQPTQSKAHSVQVGRGTDIGSYHKYGSCNDACRTLGLELGGDSGRRVLGKAGYNVISCPE